MEAIYTLVLRFFQLSRGIHLRTGNTSMNNIQRPYNEKKHYPIYLLPGRQYAERKGE